jgi:hypothetical protein
MPVMDMQLFAKINKVDEAQRLVYGSLASETVDKTGEVFDYATSKPHVEEWSAEISKATNGKSVGNLRAMHGKVAAGKFVSLECNDQAKSIEVCAKVIDDDEWEKVAEGVYTGFSIGGSYLKKWTDEEGNKRYTAKPSEGSLVDNPANPDSTFSMVKTDGSTEVRKFHVAPAAEPVPELQQVWQAKDGKTFGKKADAEAHNAELTKAAGDGSALTAALADLSSAVAKAEEAKAPPAPVAKKDFTDDERKKLAESGAAMPDGGYPIESKADLKNAVQAFGRAKNKKAVKAHIKARAKALGAESELPDSWKDGEAGKAARTGELRKGLDTVGRLAFLIQELNWLQEGTEYEAEYERDESKVPDELKQAIASICACLRAMVEEETDELLDEDEHIEYGELLELSARASLHKVLGEKGATLLTKSGARHGKSDAMHLSAAHDHIKKAMGAAGEDCDKLMPGAEKSAAENKLAHLANAHNMTKSAGAECPGGISKCAGYGPAKAAGAKDEGEMSPADHLHAAHDHLTKMGIGACGKEAAAKLAKSGARHSAADMHALTKAHDSLKEAGADCPGGESKCMKDEAPEDNEITQAKGKDAAATTGDLAKTLAEKDAKIASLEKVMADSASAVTKLIERVQKLEDQPMPHPRERQEQYRDLRVVDKSADDAAAADAAATQLAELAKTDPSKIAEVLFRMQHMTGGQRFGAP